MGHFCPTGSDPECESGSGYGSRDPIESGSTTLLLTPGDKSLDVLWVDGEGLVEALECLDGGARLEVLDALVHVFERPVARLLAPQLTRAPVTRELALTRKGQV